MLKTSAGPPFSSGAARPFSLGPPRREWLGWILLIVLCVVPYLNVLHGDFVFDDKLLITRHPAIQAPFHAQTVLTAPLLATSPNTALWRPVTSLSLAVDWRLGGGRPTWYHVVNILLYAAVTLLWALLVRRLFRSSMLALAAGCLFAAHPLHTEAVAWISGRGDLLAALFSIAAIHFALSDRARARPWTYLAILFACGSKESAAVLPILILYTLWATRAPGRPWRWRFALGCLLPVLAFLVLRRVVTGVSLAAAVDPADNPLAGLGLLQRLPTVLDCAGRYLALLVVPVRLSLDYAPPVLGVVHRVTPYLVLGFVGTGGAAVLAWRWRRQPEGWGAGWALITIALASNLVVVVVTIFAERMLFLPSAGLLLVLVAAGRRLARRSRAWATVLPAFLACALAAGILRTWIRNADYSDELTLYKASVRSTPESFKMRANLAMELMTRHQTQEALDEARTALQLEPRSRSLRELVACALDSLGRHEEAVEFLDHCLKDDPMHAEARRRLLYILSRMNQPERLQLVAEEAMQHSTSEVEWIGWAANAAQVRREWAKAAELWRTLMARSLVAIDAPLGLGFCLLQEGDNRGARDAYAEAVRRAPESSAAANGLAWSLLLTGGSPEEAERLARQATDREPVAPYFDTLARAYLAASRYDQARVAADRACALEPGNSSYQETRLEVARRRR